MFKSLLNKHHQKIQSRVQVDLFWQKKEEINQTHYRMLKDFDSFCQGHGIEYWLEGGSLIGAYFHKGIIPWDDDLDLAMTRENWAKLESLRPNWQDMVLQTYETDQGFNSLKFYKLRDKHSYLNDGRYWSSESNDYQGLFIDIFVYDDTDKESFTETSIAHKLRLQTELFSRMFYDVFKFFPFESINRRSLERYYKANPTAKYMRLDYRCSTRENKHYFIQKDKVFPLQRVPFGDGYYPAPKDITYYLELQYGKLVKYPPKDKQVPSHLIAYKNFREEAHR